MPGAGPGWQGARGETLGKICAPSNAASRDAPPGSNVALHRDGTLGSHLRTAAHRPKRGFLLEHVGEPAVRVRHLAVDDVEEGALKRLGDGTATAGADLNLVDRSDRRHFRGCADREHLVGDVQGFAW